MSHSPRSAQYRHPFWPALLLAAVVCGGPARSTAADDPLTLGPKPFKGRPNIVLIMADDLGYGDLGCYGQQRVRTPNLDRMAAEGTRFTDFYAGSTVCAPSRCVLMTGLHTGHGYIRGNGKVNLRPTDVTVANLLHDAGYATGQFGKWGLGHEGSTGIPTKQGFDEFYGYLDQHHAHNYFPTFLIHNGERVKLRNVVPNEGEWGQGVATRKVDYSAHLITEKCLAWVDEVAANKEQPFFLYWPMTPPHANNEGGKEGQEIPSYGEYAEKDWPDAQKGTAAMISLVDSDVGKLLALLKEHGQDENTIVFFTSDNGPHAEGGNDPGFFDSNGPLRGIKRALYEGGIRVPLIVRWPGQVPAGRTSDHVGYFADLMPTACQLADIGDVPQNDGQSFVATCLGRGQQLHHDFLFWEFYEQGGRKAVRQENWKAVLQGFDTSRKIELYDLAHDIGETTDVAAEHPEIVERMRELMIESHEPTDDWQVSGKPPGR
jgi:arylsulfatase A-like enzyme